MVCCGASADFTAVWLSEKEPSTCLKYGRRQEGGVGRVQVTAAHDDERQAKGQAEGAEQQLLESRILGLRLQ